MKDITLETITKLSTLANTIEWIEYDKQNRANEWNYPYPDGYDAAIKVQ